MTTPEETRSVVLDALACLLALERNDRASAQTMARSYIATGELDAFIDALAALALCAVRYSAITAGTTPDRILAGVALEVRAQ